MHASTEYDLVIYLSVAVQTIQYKNTHPRVCKISGKMKLATTVFVVAF